MIYNTSQSDIKPIGAKELKLKLNQNSLLIDIRYISSIFSLGSIPSALYIGIQGNMEWWAHLLITDKSADIYILAEENTDYNELYNRFQRVGFNNIKGYLEGGFESWVSEGFEIESYNFIHPSDFIQQFESIDKPSIIDVRTEKEFQNQYIDGSLNLPLDNLLNTISTLDINKQYYMLCQGGYRSIIAASILKRNMIHHTIDVYGGLKNFS